MTSSALCARQQKCHFLEDQSWHERVDADSEYHRRRREPICSGAQNIIRANAARWRWLVSEKS